MFALWIIYGFGREGSSRFPVFLEALSLNAKPALRGFIIETYC